MRINWNHQDGFNLDIPYSGWLIFCLGLALVLNATGRARLALRYAAKIKHNNKKQVKILIFNFRHCFSAISDIYFLYMKKLRTLKPIKSQTLSPERFVVLVEKKREKIESSRFVPPSIGQKGFGRFHVEFKDYELIDG
jgi:hypothetical protein